MIIAFLTIILVLAILFFGYIQKNKTRYDNIIFTIDSLRKRELENIGIIKQLELRIDLTSNKLKNVSHFSKTPENEVQVHFITIPPPFPEGIFTNKKTSVATDCNNHNIQHYKQLLTAALETEDYEKCAQIRDIIIGLQIDIENDSNNNTTEKNKEKK